MRVLAGAVTRGRMAWITATAVLGLAALLVGPAAASASAASGTPPAPGVGTPLINTATGGCLDSLYDGVVGSNPCNGGNFQNWSLFYNTGNGLWTVTDDQTDRCLDSDFAGTVYTNPCNGGMYQYWIMVYPNAYGSFSLIDAETDLTLTSYAVGEANTAIWSGSAYQSWHA